MSQKPSLVFVPGAWHRPEIWSLVTPAIAARGYRCVAVALPSTSGNAGAGFGDDVAAVQDAIRAETTQGRDVVLVVHSYGGHVGNSAVRGFARNPHEGGPRPSASSAHVVGIAMVATGFTATGTSFLSGLGGKPPPQWRADAETGLATIAADARDMMYHDLGADEGARWVGRLATQTLRSLAEGGEHAYAGWRDVPCWYLATTQDRALAPAAQRLFVEAARGAGARVTVREVASGHSPMLSRPGETVEFVVEAAVDFVGQDSTE